MTEPVRHRSLLGGRGPEWILLLKTKKHLCTGLKLKRPESWHHGSWMPETWSQATGLSKCVDPCSWDMGASGRSMRISTCCSFSEFQDFLKYLTKDPATLLSASDYEVVPPEHHRKAVWGTRSHSCLGLWKQSSGLSPSVQRMYFEDVTV